MWYNIPVFKFVQRKGIYHDGYAGLHGGGLGAEDQVLRYQKGVGVQQHQHHREDDKVAQGVFHLEGGKKGDLVLLVHSLAR